MARNRFKTLRILFLTLILLTVAIYSCEQKRASTSWFKTVGISIYPINIDGNVSTDRYIASLTDKNFAAIDKFMAREGKKYNLILSQPVKTLLGEEVRTLPPAAPQPGDGILSTIIWSFKFRYWAWSNTPDEQSNLRRARMFVLYHQPKPGERLPHSYGLNKGLLGYVNAFASKQQQEQNNIVIAHEFLHTVGALDKYRKDGEPAFPFGYADSDQKPLYPQKKAELMAGRIPMSDSRSQMPDNLNSCIISEITAREINWLKN